MSLRADMYRQKAAEAKQSAVKGPISKECIPRSGEGLACACRTNGVDGQSESPPKQET
jgi:hypothetical protein